MENTPLARFRKNFSDMMGLVGDVIEELHSEGMCTPNKAAVEIFRCIIDTYGSEKIISAIASCHAHWIKIKNKQDSFLETELGALLRIQGIAVDVDIIPIVFKCYKALQSDKAWRDIPEDNWPVCRVDIDAIWNYFFCLIRITCNWIHERREPTGQIIKEVDGTLTHVYHHPEIRKDVDLRVYEKMFGFTVGE